MSKSHEELNQNQISGYFRANVGILLINKEGLVLAAQRSERPGSWQLPQGGIDQGEEEEQAVLREIREALGFNKQDIDNLLQPLGTHPGWFAYQLPKDNWSGKNGRGHAQKFFAYRFIGQDDQLDEKFIVSEEFSAWKWANLSDLIDEVLEIHRPVHEAIAQVFSKYLAGKLLVIDEARLIWDEYKYRHDLIWQRIFRFTTAIVLISIIAYIQRDIVCLLGYWILLAPFLASVLAAFVLLVILNELDLFEKIQKAYRRQQNKLLDKDLKHNLKEDSDFPLLVLIYLASLGVLSVINGVVVLLIWIPRVLAQPICLSP